MADNNCDFFLEDLKDDVSSSMAELQHLERMTTDTLSFEELLAHCTALYNWNEDGVSKLEAQLQQYGYTPGISHVQLAIMFGVPPEGKGQQLDDILMTVCAILWCCFQHMLEGN
jgi:hypothetical protein